MLYQLNLESSQIIYHLHTLLENVQQSDVSVGMLVFHVVPNDVADLSIISLTIHFVNPNLLRDPVTGPYPEPVMAAIWCPILV